MQSLISPLSSQAPNISKLTIASPKPCKAITKALEELNTFRKGLAEKRDDNNLRQEKIQHLLEEFFSDNPILKTPYSSIQRTPTTNPANKVLYLAEKIMGYYNIKIEVIKRKTQDSAVVIEPIVDNNTLTVVLRDLIPNICAFPYSFLKQLGLSSIIFCENISLVNPKHISVYNQKLLNGIFPVHKLVDSDKTLQYLCRIMMYKLVKNVPKFTEQWRDFLANTETEVIGEKKEYQELTEVFKVLVESQSDKRRKIPNYLKGKVEELRKRLYEVDPVGMNDDWMPRNEKTLEDNNSNNKENLVFLTLNDYKTPKW